MSFIDVDIKHNNTNISNITISYDRTHQICSGVGNITLIVIDTARDFDPWDEIEIYEGGNKVALYYISSVEKDSGGTKRIVAQDTSKKLMDYFVAESYILEYVTTSVYWLELFLNAAGVNYQFTFAGTGSPIAENTQMGLNTAYDLVVTLLQQNGWYIYFDQNGTAIIGDLTTGAGSIVRADDDEILSLETRKHDEMLRNRAVVWGNYNPTFMQQVFADISINTPWNYDSTDSRAVVLSNSNVRTVEQAQYLAHLLLNEFAKINYEKKVTIAGRVNGTLGNIASINSRGFTGRGLITTFSVSFSESGLITTLTLDERCPRLFTFLANYYDYVYIGTAGSGVWRKPFETNLWEDYSLGLPTTLSGVGLSGAGVNVIDLYVHSGILASVTASGEAFYRIEDTTAPWIQFLPSGITDALNSGAYDYTNLNAVACTINHYDNSIIWGFNTVSGYEKLSWVVTSDSAGGLVQANQVYIGTSGAGTDYNVHIYDLDTNDVSNIVVTGGGIFNPGDNLGVRENTSIGIISTPRDHPLTDLDVYTALPQSLDTYLEEGVDYNSTAHQVVSYTLDISYNYLPISNFYTVHLDNNNIYYIVAFVDSSGDTWLQKGVVTITNDIPVINNEYNWKINDVISEADRRIIEYVYETSATTVNCVREMRKGLVYSTVTVDTIDTTNGSTYATNVITCSFDVVLDHELMGNTLYILGYEILGGNNFKIWVSKINLQTLSLSETNIKNVPTTEDSFNYYFNGFLVPKGDGTGMMVFAETSDTPENSSSNGKRLNVYYGDDTSELTLEIVEDWSSSADVSVIRNSTTSNQRWHIHQLDGEGILGKPGSPGFWVYRSGLDKTSNVSYAVIVHMYNTFNTIGSVWKEYYKIFSIASTSPHSKILNEKYEVNGDPTLLDNKDLMLHWFNDQTTLTLYGISSYYDVGFFDIISPGFRHPTSIVFLSNSFNLTSELGRDYGATPVSIATNADDLDGTIYVLAKDSNPSPDIYYVLGIDINGNTTKETDISDSSLTYDIHVTQRFIIIRTTHIFGGSTFEHPWIYFLHPLNELSSSLGGLSTILKNDDAFFEEIYNLVTAYKVELSKPAPTILYHPTSGDILLLPFYQSFTNVVNDFDILTSTLPITDFRVVDMNTISGLPLESGAMTTDNWRYGAFTTGNQLLMYPTSLSGETIIVVTISGINHLETTNYLINPYFFLSTSGPSPLFYQRLNSVSGFVEHSLNIPNVPVNIIRVDDSI